MSKYTSITAISCAILFFVAIFAIVILYYNRNALMVVGESLESHPYLPSATNVSFYQDFYEVYIEGDMNWEKVLKKYPSDKWTWQPIVNEGVTINCYRFAKIHPTQKVDYESHIEEKSRNYPHLIRNGFFSIKDEEKIRFTIAYDTDNQRLFFYSLQKY